MHITRRQAGSEWPVLGFLPLVRVMSVANFCILAPTVKCYDGAFFRGRSRNCKNKIRTNNETIDCSQDNFRKKVGNARKYNSELDESRE